MSGGVWMASYAALWAAVIVLLVMVLALVRQIGVLHTRLDDVATGPGSVAGQSADVGEAAARSGVGGTSAGGDMVVGGSEEGPPLGLAAPLPGKLGYERAPMTVVAFVADGCELSDLLLPALRRVDKQYGDALRVVELELDGRTLPAFEEFRVAATPFVVCVDRDGVVRARGRARSLPQLEDLVASAGAAALAAAKSARAAAARPAQPPAGPTAGSLVSAAAAEITSPAHAVPPAGPPLALTVVLEGAPASEEAASERDPAGARV
jgi:hypothetical protein